MGRGCAPVNIDACGAGETPVNGNDTAGRTWAKEKGDEVSAPSSAPVEAANESAGAAAGEDSDT